MYSWPAPLMIVRGTREDDTEVARLVIVFLWSSYELQLCLIDEKGPIDRIERCLVVFFDIARSVESTD